MLGVAETLAETELLRTFVGGLPYHCREDELRQFMEYFGSVEQLYISKDSQGQHKGFAFVNFSYLYPGCQLFGEHSFKSKIIEVKLNLLNHLLLQGVPHTITAKDIKSAIEELGFPVASIMAGDGYNGIPVATYCVKLHDDSQLNSAAYIGEVMIKGALIYIEAKSNKHYSGKYFMDPMASRKKNNRNGHQQVNSEKKGKKHHTEFSPSGSELQFHEQELYDSGIMITATKPSVSELSSNEKREGQENLPNVGQNKRKQSASLIGTSTDFTPISKKIDSLEMIPTDVSQLLNSVTFEDPNPLPLAMMRHLSESATGTSHDSLGAPRKLSSFSSSFYTGSATRSRMPYALSLEVKIAFYTFPGRE